MEILFTLTPAEAKRLLAKAVVQLPAVQKAFKYGRLAIVNGTTNAFVVEELLHETISKERFTYGVITAGRTCSNDPDKALKPYLFEQGQRVEANLKEFLAALQGADVVIKGANAVDHEGNIGILLGSRDGGTIGAAWPTLQAVGATLIVPVGLEKLVPAVRQVPASVGIDNYAHSLGMPVGYMPITTKATVVTEIEALAILGKVEATLIAAGGTGGSEGSTTFVVAGTEERVEKVWQLIKQIKGEPPVRRARQACANCSVRCDACHD